MNSDRQRAILEILIKRKNITVKELAQTLYISEPSIRRDLIQLENQRLIKRTHGGAMLEENDQSAAIPIPKLPELKKAEMMTMEKETTGIYLTGHPMDDYRKYLRNTHVLPIGTLMSEECTIKDEQIVSVAGIVQSVKMKTTRNNSMMSYVTVEDDTAAIEMLAFSNVLSQYGVYLRENSAVVITGRLSLRDDKDPQIVINRARPITDFSEMPEMPVKTEEPVAVKPLSGTLYLQLQSEDDPKYRKVKAIVNMFPGDSQVKVFFADTRKLRGALAMLDPVMIQELKNLLGEGNVVLK
jgi:DNA polymerase-3 subunit alpha